MSPRHGTDDAIILVKAAPVIGSKHGETVCCAAIDLYGRWLRLYPVSFRVLDDVRKFKRWDRVKFSWRRPTTDDRPESRHVDSQSLEIVGTLKDAERSRFLDSRVVTSLNKERTEGRSLALLKPEIQKFSIAPRAADEVEEEQERIDRFHDQPDLFIPRPAVPRRACPYDFKFQYLTDDGRREGTCQDWETAATFFNWSNRYGEEKALRHMEIQFGEVLPQRGLYFAMGTHSRWPDVWLINGLIQHTASPQGNLF